MEEYVNGGSILLLPWIRHFTLHILHVWLYKSKKQLTNFPPFDWMLRSYDSQPLEVYVKRIRSKILLNIAQTERRRIYMLYTLVGITIRENDESPMW